MKKKNIKVLISARPENVCVIHNFLFEPNKIIINGKNHPWNVRGIILFLPKMFGTSFYFLGMF